MLFVFFLSDVDILLTMLVVIPPILVDCYNIKIHSLENIVWKLIDDTASIIPKWSI